MFRWLWADHGRFYGPMSGWIPDLAFVAAAVGFYRKHECHEANCRRVGRHTVVDQASGEHILRCSRCHHAWRSDQVSV